MSEKHDDQTANAAQAEAKQAVTRLVKQIDANPNDFHLYYQLATVLTEMQDYEQAEELLMKAQGLFAKDEGALSLLNYGLGNVYYQAASYDKAVSAFSKVKDEKLRLEAYQMMAQTAMQQNQYQKAFAFALTVHDAKPKDASVNALLGDILMAMGNFNQAADFYDQSLAADDQNGHVYFSRGLTAMVLEQDATPFMNAAKRLDPDFVKRSQQRVNDIATEVNKRHQDGDQQAK
ncbi:hypothetical protein LROSL3_0914 [Furfurilactobacillus rossiae]|nr:hypothetical protein LROSL3_0914 [Furfurilactobacillus rossiae]